MTVIGLARSLALAAAFLLAASASAQTFPAGSGVFSGAGKIKVTRCGKAAGAGTVTYSLDGAGVWTEEGSGYTIVGTATRIGKNSFSVAYDQANLDIISGFLENGASSACQDDFTITSTQASAVLKLNKRSTRGKLRSTATIQGTTSAGSHTGKFKSKDRGSWTLAT